jgi:hypothetical protein
MNFGFLLLIRLWAAAVESLCLVIGNGASDRMPHKMDGEPCRFDRQASPGFGQLPARVNTDFDAHSNCVPVSTAGTH